MEFSNSFCVSVKNLSLTLGNKKILENISFDIVKKSVYALVGCNGAGKTSVLRCLLGLEKFDGSIIFSENYKKFENSVGFAPDQDMFLGYLTCLENVIFFSKLKKIFYTKFEIFEILKKLGLEKFGDVKVDSFSKGMKQRLGIVLSLIGWPEFLVWDEPLNGLDPLGKIIVENLIMDLKKLGKTVLFSSHDLEFVEKVSTDFIILDRGMLLYEGGNLPIGVNFSDFFVDLVSG